MRYLLLIALIISLFSCQSEKELTGLPYYNEPTLTPVWPSDTFSVSSAHKVPDFSFVDQSGNSFSSSDVAGKIYVANFFFTTCPGICPRMNDNLETIYKAFGEDEEVMVLSHTVMPWVDDVAQLAQYANGRGIDGSRWKMLTGDKKSIYQIARGGYFADEGFGKSVTDETDFLHTENVFLIDQKGSIRGVYNGTVALEMQRIIQDIRELQKS